MPDSSKRFCYAMKVKHSFLTVGGFPHPNQILLLNSDSIGVNSGTKEDLALAFWCCVPSDRVPTKKCKIHIYKCPLRNTPPDWKCVYCSKKGACVDPTKARPYKVL